jgi:alpha-acetolactate decarboxylase
MPRDIIDDRLVGALHIRAMNRSAFADDAATDHVAFQAGTLNALMDGHFEGDATIADVLDHGDLGIGTIDGLAGELVIIDGDAYLIDGDGDVSKVPPTARTPFAVVCRFSARASAEVGGPLALHDVHDLVCDLSAEPMSVLAVRIDGTFNNLHLRSVRAQTPPYPSLTEVAEHQTEWNIASSTGTVVGFHFPDYAAGVDVPGFHLHYISDDRSEGGHVLDLTVAAATACIDGGDELHIELPDHVQLGEPGIADRAAIRAAEGGLTTRP